MAKNRQIFAILKATLFALVFCFGLNNSSFAADCKYYYEYDNVENCMEKCPAGTMIAEIGHQCEYIDAINDGALMEYAVLRGFFNFLKNRPDYVKQSLYAAAHDYMNYSGTNLREILYTSDHYVLTNQDICIVDNDKYTGLQCKDDTSKGTSWWYFAHPHAVAITEQSPIIYYNLYPDQLYSYNYLTDGRLDTKNPIGSVIRDSLLASNQIQEEEFPPIALCPIGTKTINNKFLESCTEEDVGASYDITIYVGTDPFNQAGIGDGTCDRFILREVWGKGWTAVIECGGQVLEEEIIVDYSGTNGFAQDGSVYRNQHYIKYPCDLVFETFLRQMFTSTNYGQMMLDFNEHFVEDLIQQLVTNNSLQWLDGSSVFKTSTGLQKNIFYIHDTNEISYDQIPHHTTLSNFECTNSDCGGVEYDTEFLKKINESCGSGNSGGNSGGGSTPTQYTITYNTNGGSAVSSVNYTVGSGTINLASSSKTGYILDGWYSDSTLTTFVGKSDSAYTPTQSLTLYAKWTPVSYSLTYELNGGAVKTENPSTYTIITKTFTLNNPTKNGYEFAGWCDNEDLTENCQTEKTISQGSTGNKKLYAKWTTLTGTLYTVNYYVSDIEKAYLGKYNLYSSETKAGSDNETILLSDLAITIPGFEYLFGVAGTSTYGPNEPQSGYVTSTTILPDGNRVIDLYYVRQQYNIDITENGVSAVSVMGEHSSGPYYYGDNITITATINDGNTWNNWTFTDDGTEFSTSNPYTFTMGAGDMALTANATPNTYHIVLDNQGATTAGTSEFWYIYSTHNPCRYYTSGTEFDSNHCLGENGYTIVMPEKTGYTFGGYWTEQNGNGTRYVFNDGRVNPDMSDFLTENKTFYAYWIPDTYEVTYNINYDGGTNPASATYTTGGDAIILPEPTRPEYTFNGWYSDSELTNLVSGPYTPTQSVTLYAKWTSNIIHCDAGYYLPANATQCTECAYGIDLDKWCPGGDFEISSEPQGFQNCPEIQNYGDAAAVQPSYAVLFGPVDYNNNNIKDTERDCGVLFGYSYDRDNVGSVIDSGLGTGIITNNSYSLSYNTNSAYNRNIAWTISNCLYNPDTGLYDYCLPSDVWVGVVCKNGYYVPQNKIHTNFNSNSSENFFGEFDTEICVPAESGYYTNLYDLHKNDENNALANKVGVGTSPLSGAYRDIITGSTDEFTNLYKQCPDAYPDSDIASWQVAQCYATVTFMDGSTELKSEQHDFSGTSDGVNVTANAYHISNYQPTKTNYVFDGWYETSDFSGNKITTTTDLSGNKTLYAKWESNIIHCNVGYYLPAGSRECMECEDGYYCPDSRDYDYNETTPQGNVKCPAITNVEEGFYSFEPSVPKSETRFGGETNLRDNVGDCFVEALYTNSPAEMTTLTGLTQKENYNPNLDVNQTTFYDLLYCTYNSSTNAYNRCLVLEKVCKNGYYIPESEIGYLNNTDNKFGSPTPCLPAQSGYYTNVYDMTGLHETLEPYKNKIGVGITGYTGTYIYNDYTATEKISFSDWYKKCPDAYPDSEPASWQVAQCYATVTFMDGSTELKSEQHDFDGTSDGVNVTTNAYHISDYQPTKTNYVFDGWYETSDFSGNKITTATDLTGNKTLYAKWRLDSCGAGEYKNGDECSPCPEGFRDGTNANNIYMCYKSGTVNCSDYISVPNATITTQNVSATCKTYYGTDVCQLDNLDACKIISFSCNTGYEEQDIPLSATDTNFLKFITKTSNADICYDYLTFNEVSCDSDGFNKVAPGDWSATYNNGTLYGKSLCSVTTGTNNVAGNPDTTITGDNCWCRTDRFNDESAISSWVYLSVTSCESNCAQNCSLGFQMNQSMRESMFNTLNKECVPSVYTVTYNTNGGSAVSSVNYTVGSPAITLPTTTKENYIFVGWYSDSELTDIVNSPYTPTQSVTLYAKWENASYTITYEMNGGTNYVGAPTSYVFGTGATVDGIPTRGNIMVPADPHYEYVFMGWCTDVDLNNCSMTQTISATDSGNKIFYAKWDFYYRIAFNNNFMPEATGNMNTIFVPYTQEIQLPENQYSVPGYDFAGWCYAGEERGTVGSDPVPPFECMNNNKIDYTDKAVVVGLTKYNNKENYNDAIPIVELYAQWAPHHYTVVFNANGGNGDMSSQDFVYGTNQNLNANQFIRNGYDFAGWCTTPECTDDDEHTLYSDGQSVGNLTTEDNGVINLYAQWTIVEYSIKYYDGTNELSDITPATYTYSGDNQTISPIEPEKRGYAFNGWCVGADNCDNAQKTIEIVAETTGIINAYAQWTPNVYNINYYDWENELSGIYPDTYTYSDDENQTKTPNKPSKNGYEFVGWCVGVDGCDEPVNVLEIPADTIGDIDLYAKWVMTISLHFDKNTQKDVIGMPNDVVCVYGQNCVSNQTPVLNNYEFNSWNLESDGSGDAITKEENGEYDLSNVFYFSGSENVTLYAQWTPVEYTITYDLDGGNATNPTSYNVETPIFTLNNPTKNGYEFIGWCETENCSTPELEYSFDTSIGGNKTLYAIFNPIRYTITFDANGGYGYKEPVTCYYDSDCDISNGQIVRDGYVFTGWSRNTDTVQYPQTSNGISVFNLTNVPETILFNAIWSANGLPLKYNHNDGTNIINDSCVYDTSFVPTVPTRPGYVFAGWDVSVE